MEPTDVALLILRGWLGIVIMTHGVNHARGLERTANWFKSIGWKRSRIQAALSAVVEIGVGVALILGLLTALAAAGLVATMFVAYLSVHRPNGFFIFRPGEGWEYVATIAFASVAVATLGAGAISLDNAFSIDAFDGWTGLAIGLGGFVAGALQTIAFWRPVATTTDS